MMKKACENAKHSLFFDLAGDNVKWKTVSLFHVEYPEGILIIDNSVFLLFQRCLSSYGRVFGFVP